MTRFLSALCFCWIALVIAPLAMGQESFPGVDLLYPEFAHPDADARAAIKKRDFRFIALDRQKQDVPAMKRYPRLVEKHGTKFIQQPFRIFATTSQNFSFTLRARTYATDYNAVVLEHLLQRRAR
ncbi:MAG: hypothetical protein ABI787_07405 [Spartobacteria bacterium]